MHLVAPTGALYVMVRFYRSCTRFFIFTLSNATVSKQLLWIAIDASMQLTRAKNKSNNYVGKYPRL